MKIRLMALAIHFIIIGQLQSQTNLGGICNDKLGNLYCGGNFENVIDLGNRNIMKSRGANDIFIAKYDTKGSCLWASHLGGDKDETVSAVCTDGAGNSFATGTFSMAARFKNISVTAASPKAYPSSNFYILKLNFSGDPVWVKTSKNTGGDEGCGLVTDPAGNIYVAGTFAGQFECDGITVSSNGKYDMFVMKLATNGMVQWIKNFGDSEDNSCNAIYYADDKLYAASVMLRLN
jgi:hypothetical protein